MAGYRYSEHAELQAVELQSKKVSKSFHELSTVAKIFAQQIDKKQSLISKNKAVLFGSHDLSASDAASKAPAKDAPKESYKPT